MPELLFQPDVCSALNDRDLLRRFVQDADENAFAEIVRRHQGLVLGVCRRVLGNDADIDDVFQATFITLARRPRSVQKTGSLGSWLYTVAWRTSWRLVKKRRKHPVESLSNQPLSEPEDPLDRIASAQDCLVLDEELNRLPARYREVLVMTYFSSQTSQQIADQLSISKGTVDGRIRQARNMLRIRLARRGVAIGVLAVAAGLGTSSKAMASATLLESTILLGAQTLSGSVPGTTDLSHLEPFIQAETAMITTKTILTSLLCATAVVGIIGMNGLRQEGDGEAVGAGGQPPAQVDAVVAEAVDGVAAPALVELATAVAPSAANKTQVEQLLMVYHLDRLDVDSTVATFNELFSNEAVMLKADARTNSMFAAANAEQHAQIRKVLKELGEGDQLSPMASTNNEVATSDGPAFKLYPPDVRPAEKWLYEMLEKPVTLDFPGETPLSKILEHLATTLSAQHGKSNGTEFLFNVLPDFRELEMESIISLEEVLIKDINFKDMALENALTFLFEQTDPALTYEIRNEVMVVTTEAKASESLVTRVYEVGHLLNLEFEQNVYPAGYTDAVGGGGMAGGGGMFSVQMGGMAQGGGIPSKAGTKKRTRKAEPTPEESLVYVEEESLASLIIEMTTPPCQWTLDGADPGGAIQQVGNTLVVRQTQEGHREIVRLLNLLTESRKKQTAAP